MQCDFRNRNAYFYGSPKGLPTVNGQVRQDEDDHRQVVHERHLYQRPFASRFHAELKQEGDQVLLVDAASSNGTFLIGQRVTAPIPLRPGDLIRIGETENRVQLRGARHALATSNLRMNGKRMEKTMNSTRQKSTSNSLSKGAALVTGALTGIGVIYADRLAKRGYDLILAARNGARLEALSARLASETGRSVTPLAADLHDKTDLAKVEAVLWDDPSITMIVNNAGAASVAPLLDADAEKIEEIIVLNVAALTRLTYAAATEFVARGAGTIINIGSIVGIPPETFNVVYDAINAFVVALSHSLRQELADRGIRTQAVLLGAATNDIWEKAGLPYQNLPASIVTSTGDMVDAALVGLDHGELVTILSLRDGDEWTRFEEARRAMSKKFAN